MRQKGKVLITGANGFLGRHLADYFKRIGFEVSGLVRNPESYPFSETGIQLWKGILPDEIDIRAFDGVRVVIHCAYTTRLTSQKETDRVNYEGTEKIISLSRKSKVERFVFISSVGAHPKAESMYGKSKYQLEKKMDSKRDLIIKPGLIIGKGSDGSFNRMKASVSGIGIIPLFEGGRQILQTIHVDDLCRAIHLAIEKKLTGSYVVAEPHGPTIKEFFKLMSGLIQKKPFFISLPLNFTLRILRNFESLRVPFPLTSESLLGLKHMIFVESESDLEKIGVTVRSARESLRDTI